MGIWKPQMCPELAGVVQSDGCRQPKRDRHAVRGDDYRPTTCCSDVLDHARLKASYDVISDLPTRVIRTVNVRPASGTECIGVDLGT